MRPIGVGLLSTIIDKVSCDSPTYSSEYFLLMYIILQIELCIIVHNIVTYDNKEIFEKTPCFFVFNDTSYGYNQWSFQLNMRHQLELRWGIPLLRFAENCGTYLNVLSRIFSWQ